MKKFLKGILSFALSTCLLASVNVYADVNPDMGNISLEAIEPIDGVIYDGGISVGEFTEKEGIKELEEATDITVRDKNFDSDIKKSSGLNNISVENLLNEGKARISENTDPNNAYVINFGQAVGGTITTEGEQRWYGVQLDEKAKITSALAVASSADFDLYIFKLDIDTMTLYAVAAANSGGVGATEYLDYIADSGIYYFMVNSYSGIGEYALVAYKATNNIQNEPNDSYSTATEVSEKGFNVTGAIDNPFDVDFYKANYTLDKYIKILFEKPENSDYQLYIIGSDKVYSVPDGSAIITMLSHDIYYYYVVSPSGSFDENATYTLEVISTSYIPSVPFDMHTPDYDMVFQSSVDGTSCYVNGNKIDFSYSYENHISNAYGSANTYMNIYEKSNQMVAINEYLVGIMTNAGFGDADLPRFVKYKTNWEGAYSKDKALILSVLNTDFSIHRYATGAYADTAFFLDSTSCVKVAVDIDTGKIFDIVYPNVYYIVGNQSNEILYIYNCVYEYDTKGNY